MRQAGTSDFDCSYADRIAAAIAFALYKLSA
jgi:hypothetical protein